jgi:hypothetical protein
MEYNQVAAKVRNFDVQALHCCLEGVDSGNGVNLHLGDEVL